MATLTLAQTVVLLGFALGVIFGAVGFRTNFCTMGAVSDIVNIGSWNRMRMWLLAIAVAIIGANVLQLMGLVDLSKSIFQTPNFTWLNFIVGGLLFGIGMTLGSGCGSKTLIRVGGGNLKSLMVFVFLGISAYMTLKGLFAVWRTRFLEPYAIDLTTRGMNGQDLPSMLAPLVGMDERTLQIILTAVIAGIILLFVFAKREFWTFEHIFGGLVVGLVVAAGWYVTGHIGHIAEDPETLQEMFVATNTGRAESLSYVAPMAYSMELLMLYSDSSLHITFGIASALGIIVGAFLAAVFSKSFRWEGFVNAKDTGSHMIGGILMGFGGVTALGCTIGQAISGFSTLALGSIITFIFIVTGSALTMKYQYWRMMREA